MTGTIEPVPLTRNRDFQILWTGQALSALGTTLTQIAYPLLMLAVTGSAAYAGLLTALEMGVFLLATLPAGVIADRLNRRAIMITCDLARAVLLGGLGLLVLRDMAPIWLILAVAALSSVFDGLFGPAVGAAAKRIVAPGQMAAYSAFAQGRSAAAAMIGPPVAGLLFTLGRAVPFLADAVSYVVGAVAAAFLRTRFTPEPAGTEPLWKGATAGVRHLWGTPILRAFGLWGVVINMAFAGVPLLLIARTEATGASGTTVGLVITIFAAGMLAGAFASPLVLKRVKPTHLVYACAWSAPVGLALVALIPWPLAMGAVIGVIALTVPPLNALVTAYMTVMTPDRLQGRMFAANMLFAQGLKPLGPLLLGVVYDLYGGGWAMGAAAGLAAVAAVFILDRHLRRLPRPEELAAT